MFCENSRINRVKFKAVEYANKYFDNDFSNCDITVEDDGVFWVVIITSDIENIGYVQIIMKKKFNRIIKCFNFKKPSY